MSTPLEIYDNAIEWSKTASTEVEFRAIAHQVYYAAYHLACGTFGLDPTIKDQADHGAVLDLCRGNSRIGSDPWRHALKVEFAALKQHRNWADYHQNTPFDRARYATVLSAGHNIFRRVQQAVGAKVNPNEVPNKTPPAVDSS